ncbi:uncharacterized protein TNIN_260421 [Trichonephila inaurata madagascariensis]|uniref:Uncharacterized protein n=1 Tax=Trichonephila inaurata madagascariensis TaxID=2747483 RepID=A0A8X6JRG6_9ARAC|nr:uncharacterized protein TNIN_260421 [Trichonephila inaurata madagascariensis]
MVPKTYTLQHEIDFEPQHGRLTSADNEEYAAALIHREPHLVTQPEFCDLDRDLELPKSKSQHLGFRFQQWNLRSGCCCRI